MHLLIVEDEARIAKRIERMVRAILGTTLQRVTHINTLPEALHFIENNRLDLLLLDLNLNGHNGFDLLASAVSGAFHTIIISAYKDQAITAFEYGVLDFVPKPFNQDRLQQALNRATANENINTHTVKYLTVKQRQRLQLIPVEDILYIKGAGAYAALFLANGSKALHDKSLDKLEQLLANSFERIHKSYLANMAAVKEVIVGSGSKYMAQLTNGALLPIGRTKYKDLKAKWL